MGLGLKQTVKKIGLQKSLAFANCVRGYSTQKGSLLEFHVYRLCHGRANGHPLWKLCELDDSEECTAGCLSQFSA